MCTTVQNNPVGDSKIIRVVSVVSKERSTNWLQARHLYPKPYTSPLSRALGLQPFLGRIMEAGPSSKYIWKVGLGYRTLTRGRLFPSLKISRSLPHSLHWLHLLFLLALFCNEIAYSMPVPISEFWKHITCLVSQDCSWRAICLRMNHILSLTHTWFRWCLDETLDFRVYNWCWNKLRFWGLPGCNKCIFHVKRTWIGVLARVGYCKLNVCHP